jgi:hypothetical protein
VTDNTAGNLPPPDVQQAAAKVQSWLDRQQQSPQPQRVESAVDRFKAMPRSDSPPRMPDWTDPRPEVSQAQRWQRRA